MKVKQIISLVVAVLFVALTSWGCQREKGEINIQELAMVPFSGYVCGYEGSSTFIQIPAFFAKTGNISTTDSFTAEIITADGLSLLCSDLKISIPEYNAKHDFSMARLSMRVNLNIPGSHVAQKIRLTHENGEYIDWTLKEFVFDIYAKSNSDSPIYMTQFMINQNSLDTIKVAYTNTSEEDVTILGLELPASLFCSQDIAMYKDFEQAFPEDGNLIPAGETRTFVFTLTQTELSSNDLSHFMFLPMLSYSVNGRVHTMPAQTQATIVDNSYSAEFVQALLATTK